jgi:hypothetical protein
MIIGAHIALVLELCDIIVIMIRSSAAVHVTVQFWQKPIITCNFISSRMQISTTTAATSAASEDCNTQWYTRSGGYYKLVWEVTSRNESADHCDGTK